MSSNPDPSPRRPWSLAVRLTVWYAAVTFGLVFAATGYLYWALVRNMDREDDLFLRDQVAGVSRVLDQSPGDTAALERYVLVAGNAQLLLRVDPDGDGRRVVESPGTGELLPTGVFPSADPTEFTTADGRVFR